MIVHAHAHLLDPDRTPLVVPLEEPSRLFAWEIHHCFKCPIVGTCFTLAEQRRLLKKSGLHSKKDTPFEIHETMVAAMEKENCLSRKMDNLLDRKYGRQAAELLDLDEAAFLAQFKVALDEGDVGPFLWATATGGDISMQTRRAIFGDMHMTMHWNGEQLLQLKRKLHRNEQDVARMKERCKLSMQQQRAQKKALKAKDRENDILRNALVALQKEKAQMQKVVSRLSRARSDDLDLVEQEKKSLGHTLTAVEQQLAQAKRDVEDVKKRNRQLAAQLEEQRGANQRIRTETRNIIKDIKAMNRCDASCPSFDLCKKRVLIVGGVTRMEALYRDLIESSNGVFEYHDGYVKKGTRNLETSLKRADVVLCPVNCNSHAACSLVKNLGKKHNKKVHILANGSLSAVTQVIWGGSCSGACTLN